MDLSRDAGARFRCADDRQHGALGQLDGRRSVLADNQQAGAVLSASSRQTAERMSQ